MRSPLPLDRAVDLYLGDLALRGRAPITIDGYRRKLWKLCDQLGHIDANDVTPDDCRRYLERAARKVRTGQPVATGTLAHTVTTLNRFFGWLRDQERIERNPMERIHRPPLIHAEDLDVVTLGEGDVLRLFAACETWHEALVIALLAYLGPRRNAVSTLRRRDFDFAKGTLRFREKRRKVIVKPVPGELLELLVAADEAGAIGAQPGDYLVPMIREQRRDGERDNRFVWRIVRNVAARAGVHAHPHALRAAFAVHYLEQKPEQLVALQALMGHSKIETTRVYLRKLDRARAMESVRDLTWAPYKALPEEARSGFEPLFSDVAGAAREGSQRGHGKDLVADLVSRLRDTCPERAR